jgi:hypothetical protein
MSDWAYILIAWIATFVAMGAYGFAVIRRGRSLSRVVPPEKRRWM